jgi:hypothetical protein
VFFGMVLGPTSSGKSIALSELVASVGFLGPLQVVKLS